MNRPLPRVFAVFLLFIAIFYAVTSGWTFTIFVLCKMFNVDPEMTTFKALADGVTLFGAVFVCVGVVALFRMRPNAWTLLFAGTAGFMGKNILEIVNEMGQLKMMDLVTREDITLAAFVISIDVLQFLVWVAVAAYYAQESMARPAAPLPKEG